MYAYVQIWQITGIPYYLHIYTQAGKRWSRHHQTTHTRTHTRRVNAASAASVVIDHYAAAAAIRSSSSAATAAVHFSLLLDRGSGSSRQSAPDERWGT